MKPSLRPVRARPGTASLLDRGGRPTLRELLAQLEFNPVTGTLRLNGARVTLQLAEADRILRRELIQQFGEEQARILLLRRGFRMGLNDAAFVEASWPMLDRGDAFTAGTRLHMFSGIVRVETLHIDFDFARGRLSADFLWHSSLEAEPESENPLPAPHPVCWQQVGYASGYASHFFGALVVYKEIACAAQGAHACRVVGKLAEGWGQDDPEVALFRRQVVPDNLGRLPDRPGRLPDALPQRGVLLLPVWARLMQAARLPLPCLIAGPGACGQDLAALQLLPQGDALRVDGAECSRADLQAAFARTEAGRKRRRGEAALLIDRPEAMSAALQDALAARLRHAALTGETPPRLVLLSALPLARLSGLLAPALWARLAPMALELPALAARDDLPALAQERLGQLAASLSLDVSAPVLAALPALMRRPPADLDQLDALLTALLLAADQGRGLDAEAIAAPLARMRPPTEADDWIAGQLAQGGFSLPAHEARIRAVALAQTGGNLAAAARLLGITRPQLAYREQAGRD